MKENSQALRDTLFARTYRKLPSEERFHLYINKRKMFNEINLKKMIVPDWPADMLSIGDLIELELGMRKFPIELGLRMLGAATISAKIFER